MSLTNQHSEYSRVIGRTILHTPIYLYQLGWGPWLAWAPLLILTSKGQGDGQPQHVVVEFRRHGSKYYIVSGWGADTDWYRNIQHASPKSLCSTAGKCWLRGRHAWKTRPKPCAPSICSAATPGFTSRSSRA